MGLRDYLKFKIGADSSKYERAMGRVKRSTAGATKAISTGFKVGGVAAAAAGAAFALAAKEVLNFGDQIHKANLRLGVSTEALSELKYAADLSGVSFQNLQNGMRYMERQLSEFAATGKGTAADALEAMGIGFEDLRGLAPEKQFELIAEGLYHVADANDKAAYAADIFGARGVELVQMASQGAEGLKKMREEAAELGLTLSQKGANNIAAFNDAMSRFKSRIIASAQSFVTKLSPALTDLFDTLGPPMQEALNTIVGNFGKWVDHNRDLIKTKVPEYIDKIRVSLSNIVDVYNSVPFDVVKIGGYGLIGRILFGGAKGGLAGIAFAAGLEIGKPINDLIYQVDTLPEHYAKVKKDILQKIDFAETLKKGAGVWTAEMEAGLQTQYDRLETINRSINLLAEESAAKAAGVKIELPSPELQTETMPGVDDEAATQEKYTNQLEWFNQYLDNKNTALTEAEQLAIEIEKAGWDQRIQQEEAARAKMAMADQQLLGWRQKTAQSQLQIAYGLGRSLLAFAGANSKQIFAITKAVDVGIAVMSAFKAYAVALANPPGPPWTIPVAEVARTAGLWAAGGIAATAIGQVAMSSGSAGGAAVATTPAYDTSVPAISGGEEDTTGTPQLTIIFEGDVRIEDEAYIEELAEKISDAVQDREVRLYASNAQFADALT